MEIKVITSSIQFLMANWAVYAIHPSPQLQDEVVEVKEIRLMFNDGTFKTFVPADK